MEGLLIGAAAVATVGWLLYRFGSPLGSLLRSTAPVPARTAEVAVEAAEEGFGALEQGLLANQVHANVFAKIKVFNDGFEANVKSCADIRKQLSLPLEGAK